MFCVLVDVLVSIEALESFVYFLLNDGIAYSLYVFIDCQKKEQLRKINLGQEDHAFFSCQKSALLVLDSFSSVPMHCFT